MALRYQVHKIIYHPRLYWPVRSSYRLASSLGLAQGNFNAVDPGNPSSEFGWKMLPAAERRLRRIWSDRKAVGQHSREVVRAYREKSKFSSIRPLLEPKNSEAIYARFPLRVLTSKDCWIGLNGQVLNWQIGTRRRSIRCLRITHWKSTMRRILSECGTTLSGVGVFAGGAKGQLP